jgi:hypothetical protein
MGGPLTVVVLVAAGGASEPTTLAIERAASEALGRAARVVVREATGAPSDGEALAIGSEANEAAVVEVTWTDRAHRVATLRAHLAGRRRWVGRTLGFSAADVDSERGRTIGLALASMLPDAEPAGPVSREPPATQEIVAPPPQRPRPKATPPPAPEIAEQPAPDLTPAALRYALEFFGTGAAGLGSSLLTGGGGAAFETFVTPHFGLRIGGSVRMGDVAGSAARTLALLGTAGLVLRPWPSTESRPFGAALRVDYVLMNQTATHQSSNAANVSTMMRPLSGVDALLEAEGRLGGGADVVVGAGLEEMFATTYVDLNGTRMATLPPLSAVAQGGLRLRF